MDEKTVVKSEIDGNLFKEVESKKYMIRENILRWGRENYRKFPWRENKTPYSVLVSEILLKRTTATAVLGVYGKFMGLYPDLKTLAKASKIDLEKLLLRVGYHKKRSLILIDVANHIIKKHRSKIPNSKTKLLEIPYIGDYTANAILSLGYGIPSAMVDANIERIIRRLFLKQPTGKSLRPVQKIADILAPEKENETYNFALLDFGALICKYGVPKCSICPIGEACQYFLSGNQHNN